MAGDVDEPVLAGHERAARRGRGLSRGRLVARAVDDDHVEADAADHDPADRLAGSCCARKRRRLDGDPPLGCQRETARVRVTGGTRRTAVELLWQSFVLLPVRVQRGERVLPLPDDDCPGQHEDARTRSSDRPAIRCEAPHLSRATRGGPPRMRVSPPREHDPPDRLADRAPRRPLGRARIRRIAAGGEREQLARAGGPGECDDEARQRRVAERVEPGHVPRRIEAEAVAGRERPEQERRARRSRAGGRPRGSRARLAAPAAARATRAARAGGRSSANGFVATTSRPTTPSASSAAAWPASSSSARNRPPREQPFPGDEPAERGEHAEDDQAGGRPAGRSSARGAAAHRRARRRARENRPKSAPHQSQKARRLR